MLPEQQGLYSPEFEHDNCGAGFICSLNGERTHDIIHKALSILIRLEHRGAVSADGRTGDGAGILIEIPHEFFLKTCEFSLPDRYDYAVGMVFLPQVENQRTLCKKILENSLISQSLTILGWRKVPIDHSHMGIIASKTEPFIEQIFIGKNQAYDENSFNLKLYAARKIAEQKVLSSRLSQSQYFYLPSLSTRTLIYKGLLKPKDIAAFYKDLTEAEVLTKLALVHQRFSTNTFPTWDLAQPFRYLCHNGEINTLKGNISRMQAREELLESEFFGDDIKAMFPIILPGKSDSASLDMVLELLLATGRSLPEAMMMLIPEAWEKHSMMDPDKKAFYEFSSCIMEPWDGPASLPFTDGKIIGALLDRNGLRPSRYTVTKTGYVVMSSETGVLDIKPENVAFHGRLEPGKIFLVDMEAGRIVDDEEVKASIVKKYPYREWLASNLLPLAQVPYTGNQTAVESVPMEQRLQLFGYTQEEIQKLLAPMAIEGKEAIGSMGMDIPLAVFSNKPQLLFNYFKQLFAQVTNPPLDGIREEIITDISMAIGMDRNLFEWGSHHATLLKIQNPVISNEDLDKIKYINHPSFHAASFSALYDIEKGVNGLEEALESMIASIEKKIEDGVNIVILSDRGVSKKWAPIPILLACSYTHHALKKRGGRSKFGIVIESAEPREPHHFATLFGYGASAVNPYLVNEIISQEVLSGRYPIENDQKAIQNFNKAIGKGLVKIMNKIGISALSSYRGAQSFEALGLNKRFIDRYFSNTPSRIEGIGLYEIEKEVKARYDLAFSPSNFNQNIALQVGGDYRWRRNGEPHLFNPISIARLQQAVRQNNPNSYSEYAQLINEQSKQLMTIRGMLEFTQFDPIPLEEVEPWTQIVKRFKTGAMSYGSISQEAHETLAVAMNRLGGKSNSGEGGEDSARYHKDLDGSWKNSAIKQVASGRFGVSIDYLASAQEIQIKMAQGAKPGEGGQLPGNKVFPWIAKVRNSTPYVGLISPPPHHDIYSIEDLAQLIYDLKNANRTARINVKLVSEVGVGTIAAGVAKAKADVILISGYDGGTGASPLTSLRHAGLPWELGLAEAQQTLVMNDLRSRVVLECDGQLKTGRDVAVACLLGAEEFGFATAPLVATGCIMMRACHLNTCPVGIATQDPELRKNFKGTPEHVINFMYFVAQEMREIMAQLGFRTIDEMVGQSQKLNMIKAINQYKVSGIDLSSILFRPQIPDEVAIRNTKSQNHHIEDILDLRIISRAHPAIFRKEFMKLEFDICNTDRTVGAMLSHEITKAHGASGLPEDSLQVYFKGTAGQSFGAFATRGLLLSLEGNSNDYLGKSLSGAKIAVKVPQKSSFIPEDNIIIGNVALYGAIRGEAYINGRAGERFAVRNSGALAVVEGIGDHGCEYMTGGIVIILGRIGRNFAAGMSGGMAFLYDKEDHFDQRKFNLDMVELEPPSSEDLVTIQKLIQNHFNYTNSSLAKRILEEWDAQRSHFIKVMPTEYRKALQLLEKEKTSFSSV